MDWADLLGAPKTVECGIVKNLYEIHASIDGITWKRHCDW